MNAEQRKNLRFYRALARSRGGTCLSKAYVGSRRKLDFRCAAGHTWSTLPVVIRTSWCRRCSGSRGQEASRRKKFDSVVRIAKEHGGRCLSTQYVRQEAKLRWRCAKGHEWEASAMSVGAGDWCVHCNREKRAAHRLEQQRELAKSRGGACLAHVYVDVDTPLEWRCAEGHRWMAKPNAVRRHWCPQCAARRAQEGQRQKKFASVLRIAKMNGGRCLSTAYVRQEAKLRWRCANGHEWEASAIYVGEGYWCARCKRDAFAERRLELLKDLARERGGLCLATAYVGATSPMRWACAHDHRWWADATHVLSGTWCPRCRGTPRDDLARLRRIAKRRGGKCLSIAYAGSSVPLLWCCRKGHEWHAKPAHIVKGIWCPTCQTHAPGPPHTLDEMKTLAEARGGKCRSTTYHSALVPMRWRCARGHEWESRPASVLRGQWCRVCSRAFPGTIDGMRAWATKLGGRCLSDEYDDPRIPSRWQCAAGHRFEALVPAIKSGVWCPKCPRGAVPKPDVVRPGGKMRRGRA